MDDETRREPTGRVVVIAPNERYHGYRSGVSLTNLGINTAGDPATWVLTGDSNTQGVYHTYGARSWPEHVHERLRFQLGRMRDVVINTGMSGWTAPQIRDEYDHVVGRFSPHVLSVSLGTNDAVFGEQGVQDYRTAVEEIVERAVEDGARVVLNTPALSVSTSSGDHRQRFMTEIAQVTRDLAADHQLVLVDHDRRWRERFGDNSPQPWLDDAVHPNSRGHVELANCFLLATGLGRVNGLRLAQVSWAEPTWADNAGAKLSSAARSARQLFPSWGNPAGADGDRSTGD